LTVPRFFDFNSRKEKNTEDLFENSLVITLQRIKDGDNDLRDRFISEHRLFIIKVVSKTLGRYIGSENCDEYSIGLEAFNESINSYDVNKKSKFFKFSQQVIKRRLIEYLRKNKRESRAYPFSSINEYEDFEERYLISDSYFKYEDIEVEEDISALKQELSEYGITITDLALNSPKHDDSRKLCIRIARVLSEDEDLFNKLKKNRNIPRNELIKKVNVHRRTIENNRKFIIAVSLILRSNLEISKRFFRHAEGE
jgi:RNA polymerase sigma factor